MAIELRIYIVHGYMDWETPVGGNIMGMETLRMETDYPMFAQLGFKSLRDDYLDVEDVEAGAVALAPQSLPPGINGLQTYNEEGERVTRDDAYGEPLTYLTAGEFRRVRIDEDTTTDWNRAIIALAAALPPETPIILGWR